jgi:SAM-dependent methyltransferase
VLRGLSCYVADGIGGRCLGWPTAVLGEAMGKDYSAESDKIRREILARNPSARTLLDVACGTGGHSAHPRNWFTVTGVDIDTAMLDQARRRLPGVEMIQGDMPSFGLARSFDAVICLFSSIGYMTTVDELDSGTKVMADHLEPGGVLIVDGWLRPDARIDPGTTHVEGAESGDLKVVRVGRSRREGYPAHLEMHHLVATVDRIDHVVEHIPCGCSTTTNIALPSPTPL